MLTNFVPCLKKKSLAFDFLFCKFTSKDDFKICGIYDDRNVDFCHNIRST